jgi:hypothetical protein
MEAVECTHCRVLMTGWRAPGSSVQYWRCPLCLHAHSSLYREVFRAGAGARVVRRTAAAAPEPLELPVATPTEVSLALLKARANRWFARLAAEERAAPARSTAAVPARVSTAGR